MVLSSGTTNQPEGDIMLTTRQKSFAASPEASIQVLYRFFFPGSP